MSSKLFQPLDLLDPLKVFSSKVSINLVGGDYHTKQYLASEKGHKFVKQFDPTLTSLKPLLDKIKEPSMLVFRGCEFLLQSPGFPFDKFKFIIALEISGNRHLTSLPENTISQMTLLQSLNLSCLQIDRLPRDLFINVVDRLRSLVIRGCSNLHVLFEPPEKLRALEYLDLSHLPIERFSDKLISFNLHSLILRGCFNIRALLLRRVVKRLDLLDVSHCTSLVMLTLPPPHDHIESDAVLNLSDTGLVWECVQDYVSHVFFRNAKFSRALFQLSEIFRMKVCDLSGCRYLTDASSIIFNSPDLEALDLSRTRIRFINRLSNLTSLRTLLLRECRYLKKISSIEQLENLEVLDLSGCEILGDLPQGLSQQRLLKELNLCGCKGLTELMEGIFDDMPCLEKLDLSNIVIKNMPSFVNLLNIGTVITHSPKPVAESSTTSSNLTNLEMSSQYPIGSVSELHLVSTFISDSAFDRFRYEFRELNLYVSYLEEKIIRGVADPKAAGVKRLFGSMRADLDYILGKVDLIESSQNSVSCEDLMDEIMSYDYDSLESHYSIWKKLFRAVVKLKNLVPPPPPTPRPVKERVKKLELPSPSGEMDDWQVREYESLTTIQRNCLLYFACLFIPGKKIKGSVLIHLWYGEGFFDTLLYVDSSSNPLHVSRMPSGGKQQTTTNRIEEIGHKVLLVLQKVFIYSAYESKLCDMKEDVYRFLIAKAREEKSLDFNKRGNLTPEFGVSRRACLLKPDIDHPPSSQVWLNYTKSSKHLKTLNDVRTLLYINEPVVDINTKWFSYMTNLLVLHLVNLYSDQQINIVDLRFLEELKSMKQLRLLNLGSFAVIEKLPDSICQLTNLEILNLGYCSNLIELPPGIASLTNLIVLDLTQCHLLPQLPKGLASLSKLEVLKGFPVTYDVNGRQSKKACTLRRLLKLKSLRKLNLVVNTESFPNTTDLQVLRNMEELRSLEIKWYQSIYKEEELGNEVEEVAVKQSRWNKFKCWGPRNETEEEELLLPNCSLGNLNKLVLSCYPLETAPNWLNPIELQNLEILSFVGGRLKTLFEDQATTKWKIKAMKFKYLYDLHMDWKMIKLKGNFPHMGYESLQSDLCLHVKNPYFF